MLPDDRLVLQPDRCLNARFRAANCTICADACPAQGAIVVADGKPAFNPDACRHCGLCLHRCPTGAFTHPDRLGDRLVSTLATLPAGPVDLICHRHPQPAVGPASQALQSQRCLAGLAPAVLLALALQDRAVTLDDAPCAACDLGDVHSSLVQTVGEANAWASLLKNASPIWLRTEQRHAQSGLSRSVYDADRPLISRRGLFASVKQLRKAGAASDWPGAAAEPAEAAPVSDRLPQTVPGTRGAVLALVQKHLAPANGQSPPARPGLVTSALPVADVTVEQGRCSACSLCARFCPSGALKFVADDHQFALVFEQALCLGPACNICALACPEEAVATRAAAVSLRLFSKRPLAAGDLSPCPTCDQLVAAGPELPETCFVCRSQSKGGFFPW